MSATSSRSFYFAAKRGLDLLIAGLTFLFLLPFLLPIAIALRLSGEGEVFYVQQRLGFQGRKFGLLKFATMLKNSPNIGTGTITVKNDPRVLPMGRFLRKTKINELPQILNVLKGDMSIVGPRPQTDQSFSFFPAQDRDKIYLSKPGLTGIGSVVFRDEEEIMARSGKPYDQCFREDIQPYKMALELWYLEHRSLWVDVKIIALTAVAILWPGNHLHTQWLRDLPPFKSAPAAAVGKSA